MDEIEVFCSRTVVIITVDRSVVSCSVLLTETVGIDVLSIATVVVTVDEIDVVCSPAVVAIAVECSDVGCSVVEVIAVDDAICSTVVV